MTEPLEVVVARSDVRLAAVERDIRDIKNDMSSRRPSWPSVVSSLVSAATLLIVLIQIL
ncbi:hypothetical protein [Microbacterium esteraromaticum]|uniref:hypothetical protein n=1 Tax=Microbacterium esteraromaticum TaxID=57043 RepID=UPI001C70FB18|nr:hypothetical protein [Microbacterium esteraromaticum]